MRKSCLLCVLFGTLAWAQARPGMTPGEPSAAPGQGAAKAPEAATLPESAVVLTIKGVCPATAKTAAPKTVASKSASAAAKKPADCKTEITRAQFEKIANGLSPNLTPQLKHQLEGALPRFMAMSEAAKAKGLENTERYKETLKIVKMEILTKELQQSIQDEADKIPDAEIEDYYKKNSETYEELTLERLYIPRNKQVQPEENSKETPPTEEQQKAKQEQGELEMTKLADSMRQRAAAGEDFVKLQKEAFEAAGIKVENPTVNLKMRRTGLPPAHSAVLDLKAGEVSAVISDNGGHYIYKVVSKEVLPLEQVKEEIHNKLKSDRMKEMMDKYTNSFEAVPNEAYFGPPGAPGMRPGMHPQMAPPASRGPAMPAPTPQSTNPQSQPPTPQAPPAKN